MIRAHEFNGSGSKYSGPVEFATATKHFAKTPVIVGSTNQPTPTRKKCFQLEVRARCWIIDQCERFVRAAGIVCREPGGVFRRDREASVRHAQRIKYFVLQILIKRRAGNRLD